MASKYVIITEEVVILSLPCNVKPVSAAWGGKEMDVLYILCESGQIYKRKLNTERNFIGYDASYQGLVPIRLDVR